MEEQLSSGHRAQLEAGRKYDSGEDTLYNAQIDHIMEMNDVDFGTALDYYVSDVMNESNKYGTDDITEAMISHIAEKHSVDRGIAELMAQADKKNKTNKYGTFDVYRELTHEEDKEAITKAKDSEERVKIVSPNFSSPPKQQVPHDPDWTPGLYIDPNDKSAALKTLEELRMLTDDILIWDPKTGKVIIKKRNKGTKKNGTDFVRALIDSEDIRFNIKRNKSGINNYSVDKNSEGVRDSFTINISDPISEQNNQYLLLQDRTGQKYFASMADQESYITLGHELIHAYRRATNIDSNSNDWGERMFYLPNNEIEWEYDDGDGVIDVEEFETTGLGYSTIRKYEEGLSAEEKKKLAEEYFENSPTITLSENALRRELGLDIRVAYSSFIKESDGSFRRIRPEERRGSVGN